MGYPGDDEVFGADDQTTYAIQHPLEYILELGLCTQTRPRSSWSYPSPSD